MHVSSCELQTISTKVVFGMVWFNKKPCDCSVHFPLFLRGTRSHATIDFDMDKRYQVFISSTYADLKEERRTFLKTVIELDCIPAGMELFPAADEEQLLFIKRVIDDCDYYLLIIGGRYGSVDETGVSYMEQEYDYAVSRGLRVIALLHENPGEIPFAKSEPEPAARERLQKFRHKVSKERLVKFWKNASELPSLVALNLSHT